MDDKHWIARTSHLQHIVLFLQKREHASGCIQVKCQARTVWTKLENSPLGTIGACGVSTNAAARAQERTTVG